LMVGNQNAWTLAGQGVLALPDESMDELAIEPVYLPQHPAYGIVLHPEPGKPIEKTHCPVPLKKTR